MVRSHTRDQPKKSACQQMGVLLVRGLYLLSCTWIYFTISRSVLFICIYSYLIFINQWYMIHSPSHLCLTLLHHLCKANPHILNTVFSLFPYIYSSIILFIRRVHPCIFINRCYIREKELKS